MMIYKKLFRRTNNRLSTFLHLSIFFCLQCVGITANGQTDFNDGLAIFSIGKEMSKTDAFYQFEEATNSWLQIGNLGTTGIYSIAIDDENFKIFAVDGGTLGFINPVTANFTTIGNIGSGDGLLGFINIEQVYGLAFEPIEKVLYATHRMGGQEDDLLVKINPQTGEIIKQQLQDENFNPVDYTLIESSTRATIFPPPPLTETTSILYDTLTANLFCVQRSYDNIALCLINKLDGKLENVILDLSLTEMFAIGCNKSNHLFSTTLYVDDSNESSSLFAINYDEGEYEFVNYIKEDKPEIEFTGIAFLKKSETIEDCINEVNLNMSSPQISLVKAKKTINSNTTIGINTIYSAEEEVALLNNFCAPINNNFSIEIKETCP